MSPSSKAVRAMGYRAAVRPYSSMLGIAVKPPLMVVALHKFLPLSLMLTRRGCWTL
jgi:hypothetical protein